jgi:hypothetical protein
MGGRLPDRIGRADVVGLVSPGGGWSSPPVLVARTHLRRLRGLRPSSFGWGLALQSRSVTGRGMVEPLCIVALSSDLEVVEVAELAPGRFLRLTQAEWILEIPSGWPCPPIGATLEARPMLGPWPAS